MTIAVKLFTTTLLFFGLSSTITTLKAPNYKFNKKISREVLENYLDRSITMQRMLTVEGNFDDNLRMIKLWRLQTTRSTKHGTLLGVGI